ncbi:MAG TPA: acylphosphatase [Candidatus Dependentiae bacterium]|nr:acylphosphatase [Candidatus Dependentiae bacterium]HRQ62707.1 acylphosphatase [Candidatus Dependentiae bacterium]
MYKCLKITFNANFPEGFLQDFVQKNAKDLGIEGTVQIMNMNNKVRIVACGDKDKVDEFLDLLHKGTAQYIPEDIEAEGFTKDKDYRGVFRIIE